MDAPTEIWFDGACRSNPGPGGAGAFVRLPGQAGGVRLHRRLDSCTNNEAEFLGLILGLEYARQLRIETLQVYGDSKLVIEAAAGRWTLHKPHLIPYLERIRRLLKGFRSVQLTWIPREVNTEADAASRGLRSISRDIKGQQMRALRPVRPDHQRIAAQRSRRIRRMRHLGFDHVKL